MEKQTIIFLILYVIIVSTLINVLIFGNKKNLQNEKAKRIMRITLIVGLIFFSVTLAAFLFVSA